MNRVTLQVPMSKDLKVSAEKVANDYGFSSLQEMVRVLLTQFANKRFTVELNHSIEDKILTPQQEASLTKKYNRARKEITKGKGFVARSADEMLSQLRS